MFVRVSAMYISTYTEEDKELIVVRTRIVNLSAIEQLPPYLADSWTFSISTANGHTCLLSTTYPHHHNRNLDLSLSGPIKSHSLQSASRHNMLCELYCVTLSVFVVQLSYYSMVNADIQAKASEVYCMWFPHYCVLTDPSSELRWGVCIQRWFM